MTRKQLSYLCLTLFVGFLLVGLGNVGYTQHVDHQRTKAERAAAAARAAQSEQMRQIVCRVAQRQAEAFRDATSPVGQDARQGWLDLAAQMNCDR
jgi:predicted negative regulator of RcsB-dependent stress response